MNRLVSLRYLFVAAVILSSNAAPAEDDHDDAPSNVSVQPKRSSIGSRSLPRLAEMTENRSLNVRKAKDDLRVAELQMLNARVAFLPTLDLDLTHGYQDQHPTTKNPWSPFTSTMNLVANENLYDNGQSFTQLRLATANYNQLRLEYEFQRDQQLLVLSQAYYDWSNSIQQREIDENKRDLLRRQYNVLDSQFRKGLKTRRDVLRIETEMRRQEMAILTRDNEIDLNYQHLAASIGISRADLDREEIEEEEPKPYAGVPENPPLLKASEHRRARIQAFVQEQSRLQVRLTERNYLPQVFLSGQAGYHLGGYWGTNTDLYKDTTFDWAALVTFRYNLWDFGQRQRNVEVTRIQADHTAALNGQVLLDLDSDLRDVWNKLREYAADVRMTRELLALEQQSYSLLESDYRGGRANYLDLIVSLNSFMDARSRYANAYFGLKKQERAYDFHKGVLHRQIR